MCTWVVPTFRLIWMRLPRAFMSMLLCGHMFHFSYVSPYQYSCWLASYLCLTFEKLPDRLPKWLRHFTFPPAVCEGSSFCRPSVITSFDCSHPSGCAVVGKVFKAHVGIEEPILWCQMSLIHTLLSHLRPAIRQVSKPPLLRLGFLIRNRENTSSWGGSSGSK